MSKFTSEQLEALEKAIAEGVHKVKYQDKEVEYRSLKDMMALRDTMKRELGITDASGTHRTVGVYGSGL